MTVVLAFYSQAEVDDFCWILRRWDYLTHCDTSYSFLLAGRFDFDGDVEELIGLCSAYGTTEFVVLPGERAGFPAGPSQMWLETLKLLHARGETWCFWMESDVIPQDPRWLDVGLALSKDYLIAGHLVTDEWLTEAGYPNRPIPGDPDKTWGAHINGSAFYNPCVIELFDEDSFNWDFAWDAQLYPIWKDRTFGFAMHNLELTPHRDEGNHTPDCMMVHGMKTIQQKADLFRRIRDLGLISVEPVPQDRPIAQLGKVLVDGALVLRPMLVCMPMSHVDSGLLRENLYFAQQLGYTIEHPVLVVCTRRAAVELEKTKWFIESVAVGGVSYVILEDEIEVGHPVSSNHLFIRTAEHLARIGNELPWYFMEADTVPLRPEWIDAVAQEYFSCGKPFLGPYDDMKSIPVASLHYPKGAMNGSSVYPADFVERVPWLFTGWVPQEAWDLVISQTIAPDVAHSKTISHCWRASDCYLDGQYLRGLLGSGTREFRVDLDGPAVFHGCKDASLRSALLKRVRQEKARSI